LRHDSGAIHQKASPKLCQAIQCSLLLLLLLLLMLRLL
jgi:hypothetical protein